MLGFGLHIMSAFLGLHLSFSLDNHIPSIISVTVYLLMTLKYIFLGQVSLLNSVSIQLTAYETSSLKMTPGHLKLSTSPNEIL